MKRLNIEINEELMKNIKIQVASEKVSIKVFITRLILEELRSKALKEKK